MLTTGDMTVQTTTQIIITGLCSFPETLWGILDSFDTLFWFYGPQQNLSLNSIVLGAIW